MWNENYIYSIVHSFLPPSAELRMSEGPSGRPAVNFRDVDGDGAPELTAAYRWKGRNGVLVLKNLWGLWYPLGYFKSRKTRAAALYPAGIKTVNGTRWGYINIHGSFAIKPQFDNAEDFQPNGLAVVGISGRSGLIDSSGGFVVQPEYSSIMQFSEGLASAIDDAGFWVIDETGKKVTSKAYSYISAYSEGRAVFGNTDSKGQYMYGYLDRQGREVIPLKYQSANDFMDGKALVQLKENQFALIGLNGEILHTYDYGTVGSPGDGLLSFQKDFNSKYGYMDIDGNIVIKPQFAMALPFDRGRAVVNTSSGVANQYGLIDKKGNYIIKPLYNDINTLGENRAAVGKAIDPERPFMGSVYALADTVSGSFLTGFVFTRIESFKNGIASASGKNSTFFIDRSGKKVQGLPTIQGTGTMSVEGGIIRADVDLRTYYMDRSGKIIWQQNTVIPLNSQYRVIEHKYKPNKDYLVYYPQVSGMTDEAAENSVNAELKKLSKVVPIDSGKQLEYSYTGDFSMTFFKKDLLVMELDGYQFYWGAAHGMPTRVHPNIDLVSGRFYQLKDLFKPGSDYVKVLSDIVGNQIKNDPQYSYVFPDTYKGISADQPFYVKEDALYLYFAPYDIAPYAAGFPTFRIPYGEIMNIIDTEGAFWKAYH